MAAMPFPCNGFLLIQGNLPRVILVFTMKYASFLIPYCNLLFSFIENGLDSVSKYCRKIIWEKYMRGIYLLKVNNKSSLKAQEKTFTIVNLVRKNVEHGRPNLISIFSFFVGWRYGGSSYFLDFREISSFRNI